MGKKEILRQTSLFANISEHSANALSDICIPKTLNKKEILFLEGDKGYTLYILVSGNIQLYKSSPDSKEVVIKIIKPGEIFAEVILFEENRYPVSAVALQKSTIYMIPKHQFICLLESESFRNEFITALMSKMRFLTGQIKYLTNHDVEERFFLFLKEHYGEKGKIKISLSKKDIAAAIGTTPETLSRLLLRLKKENKLIWEGHYIHYQ